MRMGGKEVDEAMAKDRHVVGDEEGESCRGKEEVAMVGEWGRKEVVKGFGEK